MLYLDECCFFEKSLDSVCCELCYGELVIIDKVIYLLQIQVFYEVFLQGEILVLCMSMIIEEFQVDVFFVCFEYDDGKFEDVIGEEVFYDNFCCLVYQEVDIDMVCIICELIQCGELY